MSTETVKTHFMVTEIIAPNRRPRLQANRRRLEPWEIAVLNLFEHGAGWRDEMMMAAGAIHVEKLCAMTKMQLGQDYETEGLRDELMKKLEKITQEANP